MEFLPFGDEESFFVFGHHQWRTLSILQLGYRFWVVPYKFIALW